MRSNVFHPSEHTANLTLGLQCPPHIGSKCTPTIGTYSYSNHRNTFEFHPSCLFPVAFPHLSNTTRAAKLAPHLTGIGLLAPPTAAAAAAISVHVGPRPLASPAARQRRLAGGSATAEVRLAHDRCVVLALPLSGVCSSSVNRATVGPAGGGRADRRSRAMLLVVGAAGARFSLVDGVGSADGHRAGSGAVACSSPGESIQGCGLEECRE
jgi:hypothetical protein